MKTSQTPTIRSRNLNCAIAMTDRQAERVRAGIRESKSTNYRGSNDAMLRQARARRILEYLAMLRALGLLEK